MTGSAGSPDQHGQNQPQTTQNKPQTDMPAPTTALDPARLKAALMHPQGDFGRVDVVASAGSTNADVAAGAADPLQYWPDLSVLIADAQPAGKGRMGRDWEVPAGAAMISSMLVWPGNQQATGGTAGPGFSATGYGWLSILAGVALCESLRALTGVAAELKWPNDVVVGGRKLAGILAQVVPATGAGPSAQAGSRAQAGLGVVVGAGVNVSLTAEELPTERATSLFLEGAATLDRNGLLGAYLNTFASRYREFVNVGGESQRPMASGHSMVELAQKYLSTLGQEVRAELPGGKTLHGTAVALGPDGGLEIRDRDGLVHHVSAGDVIHLRRTTPDGTVKYA